MPAIAERTPGWDSKVREQVRLEFGSLRSLADLHNIDHSDIGHNQGDDMKVWSRIVDHFGSTEAVNNELQ